MGDLPRYLFILSEARSGSTYVAEVIAYSLFETFGIEFWDLAKEPFNHLTDASKANDATIVLDHLFLNQAGIRCAKLLCGQMSIINREAQADPILHQRLFGPSNFWLVVRRRNPVAQAVSLAHARASGIYHAFDHALDQPKAVNAVTYDDVYDALKAIALSGHFLDLFAPLPVNCRVIWYEDFQADPLPTLRALCGDLALAQSEAICLKPSPAKLVRVGQHDKAQLASSFGRWLLQNYHEV